MADNTTQYGNAVIAADDVGGGVLVQRVKPAFGRGGSATDVSSADPLPTAPSNFRSWRDELSVWPSADWLQTVAGNAICEIDGNAAGSRYVRLTLDPRRPDSRVDIVGGLAYALRPPYRCGVGVTLSRRSACQQGWVGMVAVDAEGVPIADADPSASYSLTGGIVVVSNIATATTTATHDLFVGARISITGNADPRVNGFYTVTGIPTSTNFTFSLTIGNATYGSTATAEYIPAALDCSDVIGVIVDDATAGNAKFVSRSTAQQRFVRIWNPGSSWDTSTIPNNIVNYAADYTYPHQSKNTMELLHQGDWAGALIHSVDSNALPTSTYSIDQQLPDIAHAYVPRIQWRNIPNLPVPMTVVSATKSGSTTATINIPGHGLTTSSWVTILGIRDQTNFANQTTAVQVASVVDVNTITIIFGASATAASYGGVVIPTHSTTQQPSSNSAIQSLSTSSTGRLLAQFLASQGSFTVGESVCLTGIVDSSNAPLTSYEGLYRVARTNTTTYQVELDPLQGQELPGSTLTCGGSMLTAPDMRLHYARGREHDRVGVEIESSRAHGRVISSVPTVINNTPTVNLTSISGTTPAALTDANSQRVLASYLASAIAVADKTGATINTNANTGTLTSAAGQCISSMLTVASTTGTNPKFYISLEESYDNGTTWNSIYHFPEITGNGTYPMPPIPVYGRRRYAWTMSGTSPSCNLAINTMVSSIPVKLNRRWFDRAIAPNTANSTTAIFYCEGCRDFGLAVSAGAGATVNPGYTLEFSPDGSNWFTSTITVTAAPSTNVAANGTAPFHPRFVRAKITTTGTGATQNYVQITASE